MTEEDRIVYWATEWARRRIHAEKCRQKRAAHPCLRNTVVRGTPTPCWKVFEDVPDRAEELRWNAPTSARLPEERWCECCRARQVDYLAYREAAKARGIASRTLARLVNARAKRTEAKS